MTMSMSDQLTMNVSALTTVTQLFKTSLHLISQLYKINNNVLAGMWEYVQQHTHTHTHTRATHTPI